MATWDMLVSPDTRVQLGSAGVAELAASLWPADCQTCGQPLGAEPPALAVDDMSVVAQASLHHQQCRAPESNNGPVITVTGGTVTYSTRLIMLPIQRSRRAAEPDGALPVMIVNPGMESVMLRRARGTWRPQIRDVFTAAGMVPPGRKLRIHRPIRGARARLTPDAAEITLQDLGDVYEADLDAQDAAGGPFRREITSQGGIMLNVTHVVDPAADDLARQFRDAMRERRMLCGWVALEA